MQQYRRQIFNSAVRGLLSNPGENLRSSNLEGPHEKIGEIAHAITTHAIKTLSNTIEKETSNVDIRRNFVDLYCACMEGILSNPHENVQRAEKKALEENPNEPLYSQKSKDITFGFFSLVVLYTAQGVTKNSDGWKW